MCLPIAGRIVATEAQDPNRVRIEVDGAAREVSAALLADPPCVGDWVLIHLGFAVERISPAHAAEIMAARREIGATSS